jgi:hypothetical protein
MEDDKDDVEQLEPTPVTGADRDSERKMFRWMAVVCLGIVITGAALSMGTRASGRARPIQLGNISAADIVEIRNERGEPVLFGEFRSQVDSLGTVEKDAALIDHLGRKVIGEVELEIPASNRANRRPELEVDIIGLPPRQRFVIVIDDREVGTFTTDDRGSVDMELQEGEVPPP